MEKLRLARASFAGVSHGGYMAHIYAVERPDKAICISSAASAGEGGSPVKATHKIF